MFVMAAPANEHAQGGALAASGPPTGPPPSCHCSVLVLVRTRPGRRRTAAQEHNKEKLHPNFKGFFAHLSIR